VVNCIKTTKNRDKCRSLLRSDPRAARDILPRKGDLNPIEWPRHAKPQGRFVCGTLHGAGQEGGSDVANYIKTTKNRDKCRSLLRSDPRAALEILPRKGDLSPIEWPRHAKPQGRVVCETLRGAGQEGGSVVVNCIKTTKNRDKCRMLLRSDPSAARDLSPREGDLGPY